MLYWGETLSPDLVNFGTMAKKLQKIHFSILVALIALSGMAMSTPTQALAGIRPTANMLTPTPAGVRHSMKTGRILIPRPKNEAEPTPANPREASIPLNLEAGNSDWIVVLAILIVAIIVIPILIQRNEWKGN